MANRLINEQSPYLLQHAHNPVDWYPWGDEAFELAKRDHKPLIVSIGYSACHWCHVMERESFEDPATAAYMNEHFVCIKVDREEHPDVDNLYMDAVQAISGSGGWPLNAFVTPGRIPFFGGTYFPPRPAYSRPSWLQVMQKMQELWVNQKEEVETQSAQMVQYLKQVSRSGQNGAHKPGADDCRLMTDNLLKMADTQWGGFGNAPKFPGTMAITYLLEQYYYHGNQKALDQAVLSLDKMIAGGIYDQLEGGFARYSTDRQWLAPHFEKMLYDNALLVMALCDGYRHTGRQSYKEIAMETLDFLNRKFMNAEGGYYSAIDADSEGVEGKYYTWTWEEWKQCCGDEIVMEMYFGIKEAGNWEGTNILHVAVPPEQIIRDFGISEADFMEKKHVIKKKLRNIREGRIVPQTDDKCLLSWNALMNLALTKAGQLLGEIEYLNQAERHMNWMEKSFSGAETGMYHVWKNGEARIPAKLDDYAFLMCAMIALGAAGGDHNRILKASELCRQVITDFSDEEAVFFYFSAVHQRDIPVRKVDVYDGATPSGNAVMAQVLQDLGMIMENPEWMSRSEEMQQKMCKSAANYTYSFGQWATLIQRSISGPKTIVVSGKLSPQHHATLSVKAGPEAVIIHTAITSELLPLTAGKKSDEDSLIFVCTGTECYPPVTTPEDAIQQR